MKEFGEKHTMYGPTVSTGAVAFWNRILLLLRSKQSRADNYDKAYGTLDRPNVDASPSTTHARRTSNSSLLKRFAPWTDTLKGSNASEVTSSSSSNTLVGSTASFGGVTSAVYLPPWMVFPTRDTQEMHRKAEDAMGTLKTSFENVGLLPSVREAGDREKDKAKGREKKERSSLRRLGGKEKEKDRENDIELRATRVTLHATPTMARRNRPICPSLLPVRHAASPSGGTNVFTGLL
ncbi:hypothetical protein V5O48_005958 [Marasmius crinis-equi]|uniref:Uncharacterized protein n=1 Tax=Marasmius crinis-equi TaxID=585013 RepID=A0ABR3FL15_9AGAR